MGKTISVGQLRQNPTQMLREVRAGAKYTVTDHGEPIATISGTQEQRWVPVEQLDELLRDLGADQTWGDELAAERAATQISDPWVEGR